MRRLVKIFPPLTIIAMLSAACVHAEKTEIDVARPDAARFGESLDAMAPTFADACDNHEVRGLELAALPIATTSHIQVDCRGFYHAGAERLAEFVFADDSLVFVWVLTSAEEEPALLERLIASYGTPTHDTALFAAFADNNLALRRDIPELLYYSEAVAPLYRGWFDQSAAGGQ